MRTAYFVSESITNDKGEFVPCIATENKSGYNLTDWSWGKDFGVAQQCAIDKNTRLGITQEDADRIVLSSMKPLIRQQSRRAARQDFAERAIYGDQQEEQDSFDREAGNL
jgi:hypothetical protein